MLLRQADKVYLIVLVALLILAIFVTLLLNKSGPKQCSESYIGNNKNIFILNTGGTIGMVNTPDGHVPDENMLKNKLADLFDKQNDIQYTFAQYKRLLDSAYVSPKEWVRIASDINKVYDDYDGFIIIHGTDTMAYTASALSFMLENLDKPIVLTGALRSFEEKRSDAERNLIHSIKLVTQYSIPEVTVCFGGQILRGCRSTKVSTTGYRGFLSPKYPVLGKIRSEIELSEGKILAYSHGGMLFSPINFHNKVVVVKLFPGIDDKHVARILEEESVKGVVLETYGMGSSPINKNFYDFVQNMIKQKVVFVSVSQCVKGKIDSTKYKTGHLLEQAGVISGHDLTTEAALAKLYFLISNLEDYDNDLMTQLIHKSLRGEISEQ